jgi:hypothetical protein
MPGANPRNSSAQLDQPKVVGRLRRDDQQEHNRAQEQRRDDLKHVSHSKEFLLAMVAGPQGFDRVDV